MSVRELVLRALVVFGALVAVVTELLSPVHLLRRGPLLVVWIALAVGAAVFIIRRRPKVSLPKVCPFEAAVAVVIAAIAVAVGLAAILSPPNSTDSMAYHMVRVIYWKQAASVAFFPTPYFNQIQLGPLAEYFMLHLYLLTGGDHFINLIAFLGFLGSISGVSAIAAQMRVRSGGQAFTALFCATLPNFILQASGAKNECLLCLWLVAMVYFALRRDAAFTGLSLGLALATKATAYLFAPPLLVAALWIGVAPVRRSIGYWLVGGVLLINLPQCIRNIGLSGSPMGYDSAHGDGVYRWRNEHPGWRSMTSNALRNLSEQLGSRSKARNAAVFRAVVRIHQALGLDPQDRDTTWPYAQYEAPLNANHEANANNRWHLLLLAIAALAAIGRRKRELVMYAGAVLAGFLLFCLYLKWQPYLSRLELPLFVVAAPLAGELLGSVYTASKLWRVLAILIAYFLADTARLPALENWTRPLKGPHNLWATTRDHNYFADMTLWNNEASYLDAVERTARSGCRDIGIDAGQNQLEYPYLALLLERDRGMRFMHVGVKNRSARYKPDPDFQPCVVWCPDCADIEKKVAMYRGIGPPITIGHFLLFLRDSSSAILTPQ